MASDSKTPDLGPLWTLPNALTMLRLVLVAPVVYMIVTEGPLLWLMGLIVLAVATDYFDGRIARWSHTVSEWGKVLDPLADKVAAVCVVAALTYGGSLPVWFLALVLLRDLSIFSGGILMGRKTGKVPMSVWSGKVATTALVLTVLAALLRADPPVLQACIWATTALLAYSYVRYFFRFVRIMRSPGTAAATPESEEPA